MMSRIIKWLKEDLLWIGLEDSPQHLPANPSAKIVRSKNSE